MICTRPTLLTLAWASGRALMSNPELEERKQIRRNGRMEGLKDRRIERRKEENKEKCKDGRIEGQKNREKKGSK